MRDSVLAVPSVPMCAHASVVSVGAGSHTHLGEAVNLKAWDL